MTIDEIRAAANEAEAWPGAKKINFNELPFAVLSAWVARRDDRYPDPAVSQTADLDVESVKEMFEDWWRKKS